MSCQYCGNDAVFRCAWCGKLVCGEHAKLRILCPSCVKKTEVEYNVKDAEEGQRKQIRDFVKRFWGEEEQLTFDRTFIVAELPAYVAETRSEMIGFISYADFKDAVLIVALGVLPRYQGSGVGKNLMKKVEAAAKRMRKKRLLVSTSNDDLPAVGFYQSLGFQIFEVKPNVIAEKHGRILSGIGGLPVRDELRLQKLLR